MRITRVGASCALLALLLAGRGVAAQDDAAATPTIYKWVDENGIAHYTTDRDRIPRNLRNRIRSVERERRRAAEQQRAAPSPAAAAAAAAAATAPPTRQELWSTREAGEEIGTTEPTEPAAAGDFREGEGPAGDVAGSPAPLDPGTRARIEEIDQSIAALEVELARDEERLKQLISDARTDEEGPAPLYGVPELEELARRFPKLQADLAALRAERSRLDGSAFETAPADELGSGLEGPP